MRHYSGYIFDLDGTLYRGAEPIEGAAEVVSELKRRGSQIRYVTNNSGQTRSFFVRKLRDMGFPAEPQEISSSGIGAASYLRDSQIRSAFVIGEPGLVYTLREIGVEVVNANPDGAVVPNGDHAEAVLVGIHRAFTYDLLAAAMDRIRAGASFVATNRDSTFPMEGHQLSPGAGSIVIAVETCSGVTPFVVGKPNPYLIELATREMGVIPSEALAVGDRLDTDMESGKQAGVDTHLVLTGVTHVAPPGQSFSPDLRGLLED